MTLPTLFQPLARPINRLISILVLSTLIGGPSFAQLSETDEPIAEAQTGDSAAMDGIVALADTRKMRSGYQVALKQLRAPSGNIELRQSRSRDAVYYAIAPQMTVTGVSLHLEFINSISLIPNRSQLRVVNNGDVVAQFKLDPAQPNIIANVSISPDTIKSGYNQLSFEVAQHYTEQCEDYSAPELWTQIDTKDSTLTIEGMIDLNNPSLADLNDLISPYMGGARDFTIVSGAGVLDNATLAWGGLLAQALSQRLDYVAPNLSFEKARGAVLDPEAGEPSGNFPGLDLAHIGDNNLVLFGTVDALKPYIAKEISAEITSAFIGTYALDGNPEQFAIVVSGTTAEEVERATLAFSLESFPFIDNNTMLIGDVDIPFAAAQAQSAMLNPESVYRFDSLRFETVTLSSIGEQSATLDFDLPADFYVKESANVGIALDFSYGAGFRADSVMNVYLNGEFQRAIGMTSETGASYRDYKLYIPARTFLPGRNSIMFRPAFFSPFGGPCISPGRENLVLTLSGSSEISIPDGERYVHQPNLSIFRRTGFPYTKDISGGDMAVVVTDKSEESVAAAYTLLAKLSQISGAAMHGAWIGFDLPEEMKTRHTIAVGNVDDLPDSLLSGAPLTLKGDMALPYPTRSGAVANVAGEDFWADFNAAYRAMRGKKDAPIRDHVTMRQSGGLGGNSVLVSYENPHAEGKTVTVITATSSQNLLDNVQALSEDALWGQLAGDLAVWQAGTDFVWVQRAGTLFQVGSIDFFELMRYHLARAPWWWIIGFFFIIPMFAFFVRALLKERQRLKETV